MKKIWIVLACIGVFSFYACHNANKQDTATVVEEEIEAVAVPVSTMSNLSFMKDWVGKYPKDVNMFKQDTLTTRLKAMLGNAYQDMVANWNTETPITIEDDILHTSGCKAHDCPSDSYDLYIDLPNNNINVYNFKNDTMKVYIETDTITLPTKMKEELNIVISNSKLITGKQK